MRIVYFEPGKAPEIRDIENTLEESQKLVGGYIETVYPFYSKHIVLVCNEEARIMELKPNRHIDVGQFSVKILGPFFLVGIDEEGDFCSLSEEHTDWLVRNEQIYSRQL